MTNSKKKTTSKKKASVKKNDVSIKAAPVRTFENGKMVITFSGNRPPREVTVEKLQTRKDNVATMVVNRATRIQTVIDRITTRIAAEPAGERKTKLETRKSNMETRQSNLDTQQEIEDRLQGWIDSANASA